MAYKKEESVGQAPESSSSSGSSSQQSSQAPSRSSGGGSSDSSAHAAASADRAAAANRGPVTKYTPSHRGGSESGSGSGTGPAASPAWVGKNPYEWGNTTSIVNHWDEENPERQAKLNALGFAADDPDRSFHFYEPDKGADKSYYDRAMSLSSDRNYFQAGNFWNTINGQYASEEDRVSDAMEWMKDAQIYGKWAKDHDLRYTDENGEEHSMEDAWKEIWSYANDIAGGIGDSESTRAQKEIQTYLTGGEYSSDATKEMLAKAKQFGEGAETEKDAKLWADLEKSLNIQLKDDEKRENRSKAGKLWDSFTSLFERPDRAEQGELTDTQKAYQQAAAEDQMYSGWATDPLSAAAFAPVAEQRDELAEAVKAENREAGREVYAGMMPEDRAADATESWLGGRGAGTMAGVAGGMYAVDSMFYDNDEIRELTQQKFIADQNLLTTGDQKYREESEALQAQIDEAQQRANENGENGTVLGDAAGVLLESAQGMKSESDRQWDDATADLSEGEKYLANVGRGSADIFLDVAESALIPGMGSTRMYASAAGDKALEQSERDNNSPEAIGAAAMLGGLSAFFSEKVFGRAEAAYGRTLFGDLTERVISKLPAGAQRFVRAATNSEPLEEGLEKYMNFLGDRVLGLDPEAQMDWAETKQEAAIAYGVGVIFNLALGGETINTKRMQAIADESMEAADVLANGGTMDDIKAAAMANTDDQAVINLKDAEAQAAEAADLQAAARAGTNAAWNQETAASQNAAIEGQNQNVAPAPENVNNQDTSVSSQVTPEQVAEMAQSQTAALEGQGANQQPAPAQAPASSGPTANNTPYEGPTLPGGQYGGGGSVKIGKDRVPFHYAVIPASELIPSHGVDGTPNPNYPSELQPRDRTRETSQAQVRDIGAALNPEELEWSGTASTGAPVVRSDGVVISGNGRTSGIAYSQQIGRNAEYMQYIRDNAARFGIDPATIQDGSVLVRVVDGEDHDWAKLAAGGNDSGVAKYSASESATADAKRLTSEGVSGILDLLNPEADGVTDSRNDAFVRAFIRDVVPESEWGSMYTTKKNDQGVDVTVPSSDAYRRARNALFQAAYGDTALLARVSEGDDGSRVVNALVGIAPKLLNVENGAANGSLGNYGLRDHILSAFNLFQDARAAGQSVAEMTANMSMFSEADADTIYLARFFEEQRNATNRMSWFLNGMCDRIMQHGAPESADSFGGFGLFEEGAEDTFGFGDVIEGGRENYAAEGKQPLPERDVWGRGSYEELADVAGLNQKERAEYYRDPGRARTSPTDSGYAGGSEPVAAGETDAGSSGRDGQQGADAGVNELAKRMLAGEVSDEEYLSLLDSEEGRVQLAEALGIQETDKKNVAAGLSIYLLYQDQIRQSINQTAQTDETVVDNLLGEEPEAVPEPATEPASEVQENPFDVNSQTEETNASEGVLNAQEIGESGNPFFETEETAEPEPRNVNENVDTEAEKADTETGRTANPEEDVKIPLKDLPRRRKHAKISQYFTNTLTESGRASGIDPITYNPTTEAESLTNAAMRLADDKIELLDQLMKAPAWDNEMVDAAWLFENELYKQYLRTGDSRDLNAWKRIQTYKISQTAKGLQAVAKQSRPTAAAVLEASMNQLEDFKAKAKPGDTKAQKAAEKAEKDLNSAVRDLGTIEKAIDDLTDSGMSETEARETLKGDLIDLSVKINQMRGVSMFGDMGNQKQQKKFRKLLGEQDAEFIQRFVACQAAGIAEDVAYKGKQDIGAQLNTFQKLAQLTGTGTWLRNLSGNASFGLIDILAADNPVTLVADQIMRAATGQRSTGFELGMMDKGVLAASKRAWNRSLLEVAANIDLAENQENTKYDMSRTRTNDPTGNMMRRALSRWEQWNGYMLTSSDKFFRGGIEQSVTNAIARANGWDVNNLTAQQKAEIRETAEQVASYRLFQNQGKAATSANDIRDMLNRVGIGGKGENHKGGFGLGTALTPYTTVPTNIGVKALEFSPANAVKGLVEMAKVASNAKAGTATMAQQNQAVTDFGRGVTGTALIAGLAALMKNWPFFKDWENEDDKDVRQQNKAEGKQGMQFNLSMWKRYADGDSDNTWHNGDRTIDISSIEPLNQLLTAASLISEGEDFGTAVLTSAKENFMQLPSVAALSNIENTIKYTDTPDDLKETLKTTAASTAGGVVGGFIPAPVRHVASVTDESERDTSGNNQAERALNQIKAGIPGLRQTLPTRTDNYGNEVSAGDVGTRILNTYGGQRYTQINQGDVSREAERLREATGEKLTPGRNGPSSEKFGDEKVKLTAEERKDWKDDYGQDLTDTVDMLMRSSIYKDADDDLKAQLWQNVEGYVRDGVKREFAEDHDLKHDSKYAYLDDVDNPVTFLTAKKAFDIAEENGDWDVVDTLVGPVGKLSQSEQDLMREKNRTLMSYYDYLTPNARGNKVRSAAEVHSYKEAASANAKARGVTSASGMDKYSAVVSGYRDKKYTDDDVDAFMTKQASDGDWEVTKGRAALYIAAREGGASVREAFDIIDSADVDQNGTIDEKGYTQKAMHEGTNALKRAGVTDSGAMWRAWDEIMYPYKLK